MADYGGLETLGVGNIGREARTFSPRNIRVMSAIEIAISTSSINLWLFLCRFVGPAVFIFLMISFLVVCVSDGMWVLR